MEKKLDLFKPSPYFAWAVHIDGLRERHDESVAATACSTRRSRRSAPPRPRASASRPTRPSSRTTRPRRSARVLDFLNDELEVDQMMISPAYAYEKAPDQEHFLGVAQTRELFSGRVRRRAPQAAGGSTTRRCSSTSSRARSTSSAPPGGSRATRCSAGSGRAT